MPLLLVIYNIYSSNSNKYSLYIGEGLEFVHWQFVIYVTPYSILSSLNRKQNRMQCDLMQIVFLHNTSERSPQVRSSRQRMRNASLSIPEDQVYNEEGFELRHVRSQRSSVACSTRK